MTNKPALAPYELRKSLNVDIPDGVYRRLHEYAFERDENKWEIVTRALENEFASGADPQAQIDRREAALVRGLIGEAAWGALVAQASWNEL